MLFKGMRVMRYRLTRRSIRDLGQWGEIAAKRHLRKLGYRIVLTNFQAPVGTRIESERRSSEIDIIAYDESSLPATLVFIEVKTRSSVEVATPEAAVDLHKRAQISRAANFYRRLMRVMEEPYRFDVVSIVVTPDMDVQFEIFKDFFR